MIAMETIEKLSKEKLPMITVLAGEDLGQYSQAKEKFLKQIGFDPSDLTYSILICQRLIIMMLSSI